MGGSAPQRRWRRFAPRDTTFFYMGDMYNMESGTLPREGCESIERDITKEECVTYLHEQLKIDEKDLHMVQEDILFVAYYHILKLRQLPDVDDNNLQFHLQELTSQLNQIIKIEKGESEESKESKESEVSKKGATVETSNHDDDKKKLKGLFLDMFFDFVVFYEKNWESLPDDEKKKKDYFRYVREKLKTVTELPLTFHANMDYLSSLDIKDLTKQKIRDIMNNSFLDADDNFITPPLLSDTYEMDAFQHFMNDIVASSHQAGGANTYIKNKLTQHSSKKTHRRRKSRTAAASAARRRNNRRRRTARK